MAGGILPPRAELVTIREWSDLKNIYKDLNFNTPPCEAVEEYGLR
jgi:hypothetical protein